MTDYKPLLNSLTQLLSSRLAFRKANLVSETQKVVNHAARSGTIGSGRLGLVVAQAFENEVRCRAELIADVLRQSRASWSPAQIVEADNDLRATVCDLFKTNLSQAAALSEQTGNIQAKRQNPQFAAIVQFFLTYSDQASKSAVSMVDAVISEIIAAARNDIAAKAPTERPSYVFQTFQGPVASVAHGGASVGSVNQTVGSATPHEIAEAVAAILRALPAPAASDKEATQAKAELTAAEAELREGKVPVGRLARVMNFFGKAEDIAIRAPEAAHHIANLCAMLGLS